LKVDEAAFWRLIALLDWNACSEDEVVEPLALALARRPAEEVRQFAALLDEKLAAIAGSAWAARVPDPERFLAARAWAVAQGPEGYARVLADPAELPTDLTLESLLSVTRR
jgi:hypothetical protein